VLALGLGGRLNPFAGAIAMGALFGAIFAAATLLQWLHPVLLDTAPAMAAILLSAPVAYADRAAQLNLSLLAERVALGRANAFMGRVADNMLDGLVTLDEHGAIRTGNRAARRMFDRPSDSGAAGAAAHCVWPRLRQDDVADALSAAGARFRAILKNAAGRRFYAGITGSALDQGDGRIWILLIRDVSDVVLAEREARRRERLLRDLKIRAEAATRTKTEFVATMSHELRTPLNGVIGLAGMMCDEAFGPLGAEPYRKFAAEIHSSGARLLRLLTHLLEYANAEMDRLQIDPEDCDLCAVVRDACAIQANRADAARVTIDLQLPDTPTPAYLDIPAIQKAIGNVLSNAIRFSDADGRITVAVEPIAGNGARLMIADEGCGMPREFLARCCEPFEQLDRSSQRAHEGGGLGLTVAKAFIELHGGTLRIESELGIRTVACIELPRWRT
jgi:signal transduction histidine kinase